MAITKINDCFELLSMVTYADKLKSLIKKEFSISFEEFAVLTYISENKEKEYYLKDIINHLTTNNHKLLKQLKFYLKKITSIKNVMSMMKELY